MVKLQNGADNMGGLSRPTVTMKQMASALLDAHRDFPKGQTVEWYVKVCSYVDLAHSRKSFLREE
jgi:hypothetical protein